MAKKNFDARMSMFGRLAMESGLVTHQELVDCIEEQDKIRADGGTPPKLGELMIERNILTQEEVDTILAMQSNPAGLIGRKLVENGLVTRAQLRECLDEQAAYTRSGRTPPRLGELVVEKGWAKPEEVRELLHVQETPGHLFGEFLVANGLVSQKDIEKCLAIQKTAMNSDGKAPRLGELLVSEGILRKEQVELYSQRHIQGRKNFGAVAASIRVGGKRANAKTVRGDLLILETLGQHIDGITYKAIHRPSGAVVAAHFFTDPEPEGVAGELFQRKCDLAEKLHHPAIQPLLSIDSINNRRVVVAEYIEGPTLDKVLGDEGNIQWAWAVEIAYDLAHVLEQAHALGVPHDDIRPGAIFVDYAGRARLGLWAYTRDPMGNREWLAKRHRAVPFYAAPERARVAPGVKTDMFALGMTLIHAVTGKAVLHGSSFAEALESSSPSDALQNLAIDMTLPLAFVSILARMVDPNPESRYAGFPELIEALSSVRFEEGLDDGLPRHVELENREMKPEQAALIISKFLQTETSVLTERRISFRSLVKAYIGPIVAMLILTIITTAIYRTTQASHGLMVRANWRDMQGDKAGALALYRIISGLYPKNEEIQKRYYDLALEMEKPDFGEAEIALERLIPLRPDKYVDNLELQADLQVWQGRFLSASEIYRRVLAERPQDVKLRAKLANALLWAGNFSEAQRAFSDLVAQNPGSNEYILGLARAAAGNRDIETASRMFNKLNSQGLLSEGTFMEYAWLLSDSGRTAEVKKLAESALRRRATDDYRPKNLTQIYLWADNFAEASALLARMTEDATDQNLKDFLEMRITVNDRLGKTDEVVEDYRRLADLDPMDPEPYMIIAGHYQGQNEFEKADEYFRQALARSDNSTAILLALARNQSYMRNYAEAERYYREALASHPDNKSAALGLVQSLVSNDQYDEALKYAESLYRADPADRQNRVNLAIVYTWLGRIDEVKPLVDRLLAEGALTEEERDALAVNAMRANANDLLLQLIGADAGDTEKLRNYRLILARRLRAMGKDGSIVALPVYAAVLAATPNPDTALLMEMSETANWAGRHDIAANWLELARDIAASREGGLSSSASEKPPPFRLSPEAWQSLLDPIRRSNPDMYKSLSDFEPLVTRKS